MCDKLAEVLALSGALHRTITNATCNLYAQRVVHATNRAFEYAGATALDKAELKILALVLFVLIIETVRRTALCCCDLRAWRRGPRRSARPAVSQAAELLSDDDDDADMEMRETRGVPAPGDSDDDSTLDLRGEGVSRV